MNWYLRQLNPFLKWCTYYKENNEKHFVTWNMFLGISFNIKKKDATYTLVENNIKRKLKGLELMYFNEVLDCFEKYVLEFNKSCQKHNDDYDKKQ
jgi:hypothetical protein